MGNCEPETTILTEDYMMPSVYAHDSDQPEEDTPPVPTQEQLEAARKEIDASKQRIDDRLDNIDKTLEANGALLGCAKRFADKFKKASKGGRIWRHNLIYRLLSS